MWWIFQAAVFGAIAYSDYVYGWSEPRTSAMVPGVIALIGTFLATAVVSAVIDLTSRIRSYCRRQVVAQRERIGRQSRPIR